MSEAIGTICGTICGQVIGDKKKWLLAAKLNYIPIDDLNLSSLYKSRNDYSLHDEKGGGDSHIMPGMLKKTYLQTLFYQDNGALDVGSSDISIFGWFNGNSTIRGYGPVIGKMAVNDPVGEYSIGLDGTKKLRLVFVTTSGVYFITSATEFVVGTWVWLYAQIDNVNKIAKFYINNTQIGNNLSFAGDFPAVDPMYKFTLGSMNKTDGSGYDYVSGMKAFNCGFARRLLSDAERLLLYQKKYIENVTAFWPLVYSNNNIFYDVSGNNHHMAGSGLLENPTFYYYEKLFGSLWNFDKGYTVWSNSEGRIVTVPNLISGQQTLTGHTLLASVPGSTTSHNLAESTIEFADAKFDKSNTLIYDDLLRKSVNYNATDLNTVKRWHIDELNKDHINDRIKSAYSNIIYPHIFENSYSKRVTEFEVLSYINQNDVNKNISILRYTNDYTLKRNKLRAGISLSFDDTQRSVTWQKYNKQLYDQYQWKATFAIHGINSSVSFTPYQEYLKELLKYGHEFSNHSYNHNYWADYLLTHTYQELFDSEITPQQNLINNILGFLPDTVGLWQQKVRDEGWFDFVIAQGFKLYRAATDQIPADLNYISYAGTSQSPNSLDISYGAIQDGESGDNDILNILEWAKLNNKIILMLGHDIGETDALQVSSIRRIEKICKYIYDNNMTFYLESELLPELFI